MNARENCTNPDDLSTPNLNALYFYLTEGCNLACRHCYLAPKLDPTASTTPVLPLETFESVIREAKPLGLKTVKLTGGEPLMHPQIMEILQVVQREELRLIIETNGILCTPEIAAEIAKSPGHFISVSVDGADAATHDYVRNVPGSYERTLEGIKNLTSAGIAPQIIMSLMQCNASQIDDLVHWAEKLGCHSVKFNIVQPMARGRSINQGADGLQVEQYIELGRHVEQELSASVKIPLSFSYPIAFRSLGFFSSSPEHRSGCGIKGILGVLASGHYAICGVGQLTPELVFGMAGRDRLESVWADDVALKQIRTDLPDKIEGICSRCLMKHLCLGSCVAQNYYRSRSLLASYWFCEQAEEQGLFPESRKRC